MSWFDFLWRKPQPKPIAPAPSPSPTAASAKLPTMLILRGIAGHFAGRNWPRGALDEAPALEYARRRFQRVVAEIVRQWPTDTGLTRPAQARPEPIPRLAAIWRLDRPAADSRSTSRILRMGDLDWAIPAPLEKGARSG